MCIFRKATQEHPGTVDSYHTKLRMLAQNCEFANVDAEIKRLIIQSCASSRLRRKALRVPELRLDELLGHGRTLEQSEMQLTGIEGVTTATVHRLDQKTTKQHMVRKTTF